MQIYNRLRIFNIKYNIASLALLLFCFTILNNAMASAVGLPKNTLKIGIATQAGYYSTNNPEGLNGRTFQTQPINLIITDWLANGTKYWIEPYVSSLVFNASANSIGQEVRQIGSKFGVLNSFNTKTNWHPWVGAGIDISYSKFTKRHLLDDFGYLAKRFSNRTDENIALLLNVAAELQLSSTWQSGLKAEYQKPIGKHIQSMTLSVYFLYR